MFINIGYGNYINSDQVISVSRYDSAPMKRLVIAAKDKDMAIDATQGRKTKSVIVTNGGFLILSALLPDTIAGRFQGESNTLLKANTVAEMLQEDREDE